MRAVVGLALLMLMGCDGFRKGDVYRIDGGTTLYCDAGAFEDARQRAAAGVPYEARFGKEWPLIQSGKIIILGGDDAVRVVAAVPGGARVAVVQGRSAGSLGWIRAEELPAGKRVTTPAP